MSRDRAAKQIRHFKGEIKRLEAENRRLKNKQVGIILDKNDDNVSYNGHSEPIPCFHCKNGFMSEIEIVGKQYWRCVECGRTKKV